MTKILRFQVSEFENKKRLDEFLFSKIGAVSRMYLRRLAKENKCAVGGAPQQPGFRLRTGDTVEIEIDLSAETSMKPEPIPLEIVYEDAEIIVVNKPPEMLVHPTRNVKSGTLLNALVFHLNFSPQRHGDAEQDESGNADGKSEIRNSKSEIVRPGLVHRLDKKTSGLLVAAKTASAHRILSDHFTRKLVEKKYFAVVEGTVERDSGTIDAPIGHDEAGKKWTVAENGKAAETRFRVLERRADTTLLELEPVTGRTNQLRVHCAFSGHPILGDVQRGGREFSRLCLHAAKLGFRHPAASKQMKFETELPDEMK